MGECYVVFVGRIPGIYSSWAAAAPEVIGYKRAIHPSFPTMEEGVRAWMAFLQLGDGASGSKSTGVQVKEEAVSPGGGQLYDHKEVVHGDAGKSVVTGQGPEFGVFHGATVAAAQIPGTVPSGGTNLEGLRVKLTIRLCYSRVFVFKSSTLFHFLDLRKTKRSHLHAPSLSGTALSRVVAALESLEGRVSQLVVDKWELLMQMAHVMQQMAGLLTKNTKK
ncbi:hypothetical protein PIB30_037459 [Stylosanthes scabra]|uniref:Ribonuclease H1 N-terminal domain-containing protein n=1 Tax=Stylosanthes scabra TaxID=79078 RepID=A0ABU6TDD6_9FABA|nr:hypothetical protein [Stylosanthes scabra]